MSVMVRCSPGESQMLARRWSSAARPRRMADSISGESVVKRIVLAVAAVMVVVVVAAFAVGPGILERSFNQVIPHQPYAVSERAQTLHDDLLIADLHADTLLWRRDPLDRAERGHVDVPRLVDGNVAVQVFAAVTKVPSGLNYEENTADSDQITG